MLQVPTRTLISSPAPPPMAAPGPSPDMQRHPLFRLLSSVAIAMLALTGGSLTAQLIPKGVTPSRQEGVPTRLSGTWQGTAREVLEQGQDLQYELTMTFAGDDAALQLDVRATARVPIQDGTKVTVEVAAHYHGTFRDGGLAMNSDRIDVRIVESGEKVPSTPQQVEGRLENGVLTGRVGTAQDGWTTFSVRPKDARPADPAVASFTGRWRGTCREAGPDGKEMSYPITVEFTGSGDALRAAVSADLRYPTQGGGTTAVEYRAKFGGNVAATGMTMRSEEVSIRLPEMQRNVPGPQQELTGRIDGGVMTARISSPGQTDSQLELRPEGGGMDRRNGGAGRDVSDDRGEAAAPALTGSWTGTCRETGPDGKEMSYPVTLRFTGADNDLRAELAADLRYPMQDGSTTAVEIRSTLRGNATGGEIEMRSERVDIRLPELQRNETGPEQKLAGRVEQGVLRARVSAVGQSDTHLELRLDTGARREPGGREGGGDPDKRQTRDNGPSPYDTLILEPKEVRDPAMGNIASHTMLVPKGWDFRGSVLWVRDVDMFVHFTGTLTGPGRESLHFDRGRQFVYQTVSSQFGNQDDNRGQENPTGTFARKAPRGPGEAAIEVVLRELRPQATGMVLVSANREPELEAKVREQNADRINLLEQIARTTQGGGGVSADASPWLVVERARVRYEEGGVQWEEEVRGTLMGIHYRSAIEGMATENGVWSLTDVTTARAPVGQLDSRLATLWTLAGSVRPTPRWHTAVMEIRIAITKAQMESQRQDMQARFEASKRRGEDIAKSQSDISDMSMKAWRERQASSDRIQKATIETINGVNDFRAADGEVHTVTNSYDRAFVNPNGGIILTNNPNYRTESDPLVNGVTWDEMQRIDPFRPTGR